MPRTRTTTGGIECSIALVTSSETPSSAEATSSGRPSSVNTLFTHSRASLTARGVAGRVKLF